MKAYQIISVALIFISGLFVGLEISNYNRDKCYKDYKKHILLSNEYVELSEQLLTIYDYELLKLNHKYQECKKSIVTTHYYVPIWNDKTEKYNSGYWKLRKKYK